VLILRGFFSFFFLLLEKRLWISFCLPHRRLNRNKLTGYSEHL
jgi:hypothetical protein